MRLYRGFFEYDKFKTDPVVIITGGNGMEGKENQIIRAFDDELFIEPLNDCTLSIDKESLEEIFVDGKECLTKKEPELTYSIPEHESAPEGVIRPSNGITLTRLRRAGVRSIEFFGE